jgi:DNA polymerase
MNERMLKELELLDVTRLYGLATGPAHASPEVKAIVKPATGAEGNHEVKTQAKNGESAVSGMGWDALRSAVRECTKCELCKQRKQAVFGVGAESAPWLFVGEGPGADEDEQGEPFVGQAGKLLDNMLAATGLKRGREAYIANVVKCRPPGNRTPRPEEAAACAPFLDRQIALIAPRLIVAMGKTAAVRLLGDAAAESSLGSLRGRAHRYQGIPLVITYHPAYLLRNLPDKSKAWEDMLFARRTLG